MDPIAAFLFVRAERLGWTTPRLAEKLGYSIGTVRLWRQGRHKMTLLAARDLAALLGLTLVLKPASTRKPRRLRRERVETDGWARVPGRTDAWYNAETMTPELAIELAARHAAL